MIMCSKHAATLLYMFEWIVFEGHVLTPYLVVSLKGPNYGYNLHLHLLYIDVDESSVSFKNASYSSFSPRHWESC